MWDVRLRPRHPYLRTHMDEKLANYNVMGGVPFDRVLARTIKDLKDSPLGTSAAAAALSLKPEPATAKSQTQCLDCELEEP